MWYPVKIGEKVKITCPVCGDKGLVRDAKTGKVRVCVMCVNKK